MPKQEDGESLDQDLARAPLRTVAAMQSALERIEVARAQLALNPAEHEVMKVYLLEALRALTSVQEAADIDTRTLALWGREAPLTISSSALGAASSISAGTISKLTWIPTKYGDYPTAPQTPEEPNKIPWA